MTYKNKIATVALSTLIATSFLASGASAGDASALRGAKSAAKDNTKFTISYELAALHSSASMADFEERLRMEARDHCRTIPAIGVGRAERACSRAIVASVMERMKSKRAVYVAENRN